MDNETRSNSSSSAKALRAIRSHLQLEETSVHVKKFAVASKYASS